MIPTKRLTPLAFGYRVTSRRPPAPELVIVLRAKLALKPNATLELARGKGDAFDGSLTGENGIDAQTREALDQAALWVGQGSLTGEAYEEQDSARRGQLVYPGDFAEYKPRADVMVRGTCWPRAGSATECTAGFAVGAYSKEVRVVGPRVWVDQVLGGSHTAPLAFEKMPVDWAHAYGGPDVEANPVGRGLGTRELPNVEDPKRALRDYGDAVAPAGLGPVNPAWPLRKLKTGTKWGEEWEKTRAPWVAVDYDWGAQNAAPADQQLEQYLRGDEVLKFWNLHPRLGELTCALPGIRPRAFVMLDTEEMLEATLALDTLFADLDDGFVYLTWRGHVRVREDDLSDVKFMLVADEPLAEAKRPGDEYRAKLRAFADDPYGLAQNPASELAKLEEKLESGELEIELARVEAEGGDPIAAVIAPLAKGAPGAADKLAGVSAQLAKQLAAQASSGAANAANGGADPRAGVRGMLLASLRSAFDGPAAPKLLMNAKGEADPGPMLRRMTRDLAKQQRELGDERLDKHELLARVNDAIAATGVVPAGAEVSLPESLEPPEPAPGADFSGCDLEMLDLAGRDLRGCNFDGAVLRYLNLRGAVLRGSSFRGAVITRCDLRGADLRDCDFTQAHLSRPELEGADLRDAKLDQAALVRGDLRGAKLAGATASMLQAQKTDFSGADAAKAKLEKCAFDGCPAEGAKFVGASLAGSLFRECGLGRASFESADVSRGAFYACKLPGASFYAARGDTTSFQFSSLEDADFRYASMPSSFFMGVPATRADFGAATLRDARFYRAALRGARFERADLFQVDMRKAVLTDASFHAGNCYRAIFVEAHGTGVDFREAKLGLANFQRSHLVKKT